MSLSVLPIELVDLIVGDSARLFCTLRLLQRNYSDYTREYIDYYKKLFSRPRILDCGNGIIENYYTLPDGCYHGEYTQIIYGLPMVTHNYSNGKLSSQTKNTIASRYQQFNDKVGKFNPPRKDTFFYDHGGTSHNVRLVGGRRNYFNNFQVTIEDIYHIGPDTYLSRFVITVKNSIIVSLIVNGKLMVKREWDENNILVNCKQYCSRGERYHHRSWNGGLVSKKSVCRGLLHGRNKTWSEEGISISSSDYYFDVLDGHHYTFNKFGRMISNEFFLDGKLHYDSQKFNDEGILIAEDMYHHNILHGLSSRFDNTGALMKLGYYYQGILEDIEIHAKDGTWVEYNFTYCDDMSFNRYVDTRHINIDNIVLPPPRYPSKIEISNNRCLLHYPKQTLVVKGYGFWTQEFIIKNANENIMSHTLAHAIESGISAVNSYGGNMFVLLLAVIACIIWERNRNYLHQIHNTICVFYWRIPVIKENLDNLGLEFWSLYPYFWWITQLVRKIGQVESRDRFLIFLSLYPRYAL